jgi:hypothetical protein
MTEIRKEFMGKERTTYMTGYEVEKTLAYGQNTLFVQTYQSAEDIHNQAVSYSIKHIYLGANRSFRPTHLWNTLIRELLALGYIVTLDYPVVYHSSMLTILNTDVWNNEKFIPMITVDITDINRAGKNIIVKIDDPTSINPGVWCLSKKELLNPAKYTAWSEYADDENIK